MEPPRRRRFAGDEQAPRTMPEILDSWLAAEGLGELRWLTAIRSEWEELVGPEIARHASPRGLKDGVLVVAVDHGGWATELKFQERRLIKRLEEQFGRGVVSAVEARVLPSSGLEWK